MVVNKKDISIFEIEEFPIGKKLKVLAKFYQANLSEYLKYIGLEKHFSVLMLLHNIDEGCNQKLLANKLYIDPTSMVGVIDELVDKGFIERVKNPDDRRECLVHLTNKAKKCIPEIKNAIHRTNNKLTSGCNENEKAQLSKLLILLYENMLK